MGQKREIPKTVLVELNEEDGKKLNQLKILLGERSSSKTILKIIRHFSFDFK